MIISITILTLPASLLAQSNYEVKADELEIFNQEGRAVFQGNVKVWNDTGEIMCNRLEAFYSEGGDTIDYLKAYGDVIITRQNFQGEANFAHHDISNDTALLQGDVYVKRSNNEFWSDRMWINLATEHIKMLDNVRGRLDRANKSRETAN